MTHRGKLFFLVNWLKKEPYIRSHPIGGAKNGGNSPPQSDPSDLRKVRSCLAGAQAQRRVWSREHLTEREVGRLIEAAKDNRWGHRDATMVLLAFRHGLRAAELVDLRWEQVAPTPLFYGCREGVKRVSPVLDHGPTCHHEWITCGLVGRSNFQIQEPTLSAISKVVSYSSIFHSRI